MSYDIRLIDKETKEALPMETTHVGGTMPIGGYDTTDFNITYNYSWFYYHFIDKEQGIRWLYGKTGKETVERLQSAIDELGTRTDSDYWKNTPGNAGAALLPLLEAAKQYPEAIWEGD